jgi:endonuclease-3
MSASNRQALITKTYKGLKKHYDPVAPPADRQVLEHLLYACCLENAKHESVDEVFAKLEQNFFDWNEVRVTTFAELAEVMSVLPDAMDAAKRLKRTMQSVFETHYSFDLDFLKKQNLGKSIKELERFNGVTPFALAYVTQNALGGHSIPVNDGALGILTAVGVITEAEAAKRRVPGMERAIPKTKGVEFASLLHQIGVEFATTPFSPRVRSIVLEIAPDAKDRLPKRGAKKDAAAAKKSKAAKKKLAKSDKPKGKTKAAETVGKKSAPRKKKSTTKSLSRKKPR